MGRPCSCGLYTKPGAWRTDLDRRGFGSASRFGSAGPGRSGQGCPSRLKVLSHPSLSYRSSTISETRAQSRSMFLKDYLVSVETGWNSRCFKRSRLLPLWARLLHMLLTLLLIRLSIIFDCLPIHVIYLLCRIFNTTNWWYSNGG